MFALPWIAPTPSRQRRIAVASTTALGVSLALLSGGQATAAPFDDGVAAEARGDVAAAIASYRTAADAGVAPAQFALGRLYASGHGVARDPALAGAWFRKAANQNNPGAEYALATMMQSGALAPLYAGEAAQWRMKAARQGYEPAEADLADRYTHGDGVARDLAQAIHWANAAAQQGDADQQFKLGSLYIERAREGPTAASLGAAGRLDAKTFSEVMDHVFGHAKWRETSGYRTRAEENALRAAGAMTVPEGALSHHSMGTREAPGAYDIVVSSMSKSQAAARLLRSGVKFRRVFAEGAHGPEGPHLHVEPNLGAKVDPALFDVSDAGDASGASLDAHTPASDYEHAGYWLRQALSHGRSEAAKILATLPTAKVQ